MSSGRALLASLVVLLPVGFAARPCVASWPHNPSTNLPVCTATGNQLSTLAVSDGAGGEFVVWQDLRSGATSDVYAHHVLATGTVDPGLPTNGVAVCTAANTQSLLAIISDDAGGAIIAWRDLRGGSTSDIYAQHLLPSGAVDGAWPANGRAICTAIGDQLSPTMATDGAHGAIIAWVDGRGASYYIYAQHLLSSGGVDGVWPVNGTLLTPATCCDQTSPTIVSDRAGGAIVAWQDFRNTANFDIYASRVLTTGVVASTWPVSGLLLCNAANSQITPLAVSDGANGAFVVWQDSRVSGDDLYAQHVQGTGDLDANFPANGRAITTATGSQVTPVAIADGSGGVLMAWQDNRNANNDIYAHHLLASGAVDAAWPANGLAVVINSRNQSLPVIVSDGLGGVLIAWFDVDDVYAQHVLASGLVDGVWPANGRPVCNASGVQFTPAIATDGGSGAIVTWEDYRGGSGAGDIFAQRVERFGNLGSPEASIAAVRDVANDEGGKVNVAWTASWLDTESPNTVDHYWIFRSMVSTVATAALRSGARLLRAGDDEPRAGEPAILAITSAATTYFWEYLGNQTAYHFLPGYSFAASTQGDSTANGNPPTAFMVVALNASGSQYWLSSPASGYSVDNLPPAAPSQLTGNYLSGATHLHWNPNTEPDLALYRLYRGSSAGFTPGPGNRIGAPVDTGFVDPGAAGGYYKLSAVDSHGNESGYRLLSPVNTTAVPGGQAGGELTFSLPHPNPAFAPVMLRFSLPSESWARLDVYDARGGRVRTLVDGMEPAGDRDMRWDLRDRFGKTVPTGLYFLRLEVAGRVLIRKLVAGH